MNKILLLFQNLKYRTKLIALCAVVSILPLTIMGSFCYQKTRELLENQELTTMSAAAASAGNSLQTQIVSYENLLTYLSRARQLTDIPVNFEATYEQFEYITYTLDPFLSNILSIHPEIKQITIYNSSGDLTHGQQYRPVSDLEGESWYSPEAVSTKPAWYRNDDGSIIVIQKLLDSYIRIATSYSANYVAIRLDSNVLFSSLNYVYNDFLIQVHSPYQLLYGFTSDSVSDVSPDPSLWTGVDAQVPGSDWTLRLQTPSRLLFAPVSHMTVVILLIILGCLLLILTTSQLYTYFFMKRIDALHYYMERIKEGHLDVHLHDDCKDELGDLANNLQLMIDEINRLIQENYKNKLDLRETQLKALQAQINPHFLYNCLSLINSKALMNHQTEISEMSQLLSVFYRTTLNKGRADTTLQDEIKNVTSYIHIQQLLHDNCFDVIYQIDTDLPSMPIPNLLLQPLVENAIIHGILPNKARRGQLFLAVAKISNRIQITIMDNGLGIEKEKQKTLLQTDSSGYGLKNVHERLKLSYGDDSGLTIQSIPSESTMIAFCLPCP